MDVNVLFSNFLCWEISRRDYNIHWWIFSCLRTCLCLLRLVPMVSWMLFTRPSEVCRRSSASECSRFLSVRTGHLPGCQLHPNSELNEHVTVRFQVSSFCSTDLHRLSLDPSRMPKKPCGWSENSRMHSLSANCPGGFESLDIFGADKGIT